MSDISNNQFLNPGEEREASQRLREERGGKSKQSENTERNENSGDASGRR